MFVKIIVITLGVGLILYSLLRAVLAFKDVKKRAATGRSIKNRTNYNLDLRRFFYEKLHQRQWIAWLVGGIIVISALSFFVDVSIEARTSIVVGLSIIWMLLLIAVSGVIMTGANGPDQAFMKKYSLERLPDGPVPQNMTVALTWSRLFRDVVMPRAKFAVYGQRDFDRSTRTPGAQWWVMRYSFEFKAHSAATRELYEYSLFAFRTDQLLPEFVIDGGDVYDFSYFVPEASREVIHLEGDFGKKYCMFVPKAPNSENRLLALSVMTPDVMAIYQDFFAKSCMIIEGNTIVLLTRQDIFEEQNYERFYEGIDQLVGKIIREGKIHANVGKL